MVLVGLISFIRLNFMIFARSVLKGLVVGLKKIGGKMKDKKKLILKTIQEIYKEYSEKREKAEVYSFITRYNDLDMDRCVLKVLVDIYTFDDEEEEENRYIYHDWDLIEFMITDVLGEE